MMRWRVIVRRFGQWAVYVGRLIFRRRAEIRWTTESRPAPAGARKIVQCVVTQIVTQRLRALIQIFGSRP